VDPKTDASGRSQLEKRQIGPVHTRINPGMSRYRVQDLRFRVSGLGFEV
jgi:hypothetical protein